MVTEVMTTDMRTGGGSVRRSGAVLSKPPVQGDGDFNPSAFIAANAVAYWTMDGSLGDNTQEDVTSNDNDLYYSVGFDDAHYAAGKVGTAAQLLADGDYWSRASTAGLQIGAHDFIVCCWVKPASVSNVTIIGKPGDSWLQIGFDALVFFAVGDGAGSNTASGFGALSTDTWYFIVARFNADAQTVSIRINNSAVEEAACGDVPAPSANDFFVGSYDGAGGFFDGLIDNTLIIKTTETMSSEDFDALCSYLYAGGAGLDLSFIF